MRNELSLNTTFYVDSTIGNDANDGLSAPKQTLQAMIDDLQYNWDLRGYKATVQLSGTTPFYTGLDMSGKLVGQRRPEDLQILGNTSNPGLIEFFTSLTFRAGAMAKVSGLWTHNGNYGLLADRGGTYVLADNIWFGHQFIPLPDAAIVAGVGANIQISGGLRMLGNAVAFIKSLGPSQAQIMPGATALMVNNPNFSLAFAYAAEGGLINTSLGVGQIAGYATGTAQAVSSLGSKIYTAGTYVNYPGTPSGNSVDSTSVLG